VAAKSVSCFNFSRETSEHEIEISLSNIFLGGGNFFARIERDACIAYQNDVESDAEVAGISAATEEQRANRERKSFERLTTLTVRDYRK